MSDQPPEHVQKLIDASIGPLGESPAVTKAMEIHRVRAAITDYVQRTMGPSMVVQVSPGSAPGSWDVHYEPIQIAVSRAMRDI